MKKTILSVAILLASTLGITAVAQTPADSQATSTTQVCKARKGKPMNRPNPFEGLNLTEQQKAELQALAPSKQGQKCDSVANGKCAKAKNGQCDKAKVAKKDKSQAMAEKQAQRNERRQQKIQMRRDYLAKVKNILTPEQYVQFLENNYVDQISNGKKAPGKNMAQKGRKGHKNHARNNGKRMRTNKPGAQQQNGNQQLNNTNKDNAYYIDNGKIKVFPYQAQN